MGLSKLAERIYFLEHEPEVDRLMLAYIKGDRLSLAIDAGYSSAHVQVFYKELESEHKKQILQQLHIGIMTILLACMQSMESVLLMIKQMSFSAINKNWRKIRIILKS